MLGLLEPVGLWARWSVCFVLSVPSRRFVARCRCQNCCCERQEGGYTIIWHIKVMLSYFAVCNPIVLHRPLLRQSPIALCVGDASELVSTIKSVGIMMPGDKRIRVTASDVSAATGLEISSSRQALTQLSVEINGGRICNDRSDMPGAT